LRPLRTLLPHPRLCAPIRIRSTVWIRSTLWRVGPGLARRAPLVNQIRGRVFAAPIVFGLQPGPLNDMLTSAEGLAAPSSASGCRGNPYVDRTIRRRHPAAGSTAVQKKPRRSGAVCGRPGRLKTIRLGNPEPQSSFQGFRAPAHKAKAPSGERGLLLSWGTYVGVGPPTLSRRRISGKVLASKPVGSLCLIAQTNDVGHWCSPICQYGMGKRPC